MPIRRRTLARPRLMLLALLAISLVIGTIAPAGYMIAPADDGWPSVTLCPEQNPLVKAQADAAAQRHHAAMGHMSLGDDADEGEQSPSSALPKHCSIAGTTELATGAVDADLLALSLAEAALLGLAPVLVIDIKRTPRLRPPLRAPPVLI